METTKSNLPKVTEKTLVERLHTLKDGSVGENLMSTIRRIDDKNFLFGQFLRASTEAKGEYFDKIIIPPVLMYQAMEEESKKNGLYLKDDRFTDSGLPIIPVPLYETLSDKIHDEEWFISTVLEGDNLLEKDNRLLRNYTDMVNNPTAESNREWEFMAQEAYKVTSFSYAMLDTAGHIINLQNQELQTNSYEA